MFRVDGVEPAHERPLAEVRDQVEQAWRAAEQKERAKARAEELRPPPRARRPCASCQQRTMPTLGWSTIAPLLRTDDGAAQGLSPAAVAALFATPGGRGRERRGRGARRLGDPRRRGGDPRGHRRPDAEARRATTLTNSHARRAAGRLRVGAAPALQGLGQPVDAGAADGAKGAMTVRGQPDMDAQPDFDDVRRRLRGRHGPGGLDLAGGRPRDTGLGAAQARRRPALQLPARERRPAAPCAAATRSWASSPT